ncbi:repulsive guidance molecule A isoform X2 [Carcharodon carcharias]|uniref:repulsive guidance molecule A isoform X2 n=1 Tax=Carcharodon carcharias TaxID=13397 RepID=UPI001B7DEC61|nr:repulsive guidance molecule A isoform X2 [Carcharodon carcharias]
MSCRMASRVGELEFYRIPVWAGWMGMGRRGDPLDHQALRILIIVLCLPAVSCQCRILKCNSEYLTATSGLHVGAEESLEFCIALRAYSQCTRKTARACRGDLAYHSAVHGIEDLMSQHNCSKVGPTHAPPRTQPTSLDCMVHSDAPEVCNYEKSLQQHTPPPNYTHCGLFGDPHLRTFTDDFQTCKVRGAWPLIDNNYLFVQVTNVAVVQGSSATATSKLTVIFKNFQECVDQKVYQAETDDLPAAFVDGSRNGGEKHGANSLRVTEKVAGQHIEIQAKYIGTTIVVRQVGRYLTFAVRMPEEVMNSFEDNQGLQLCLKGCPTNERMDWRLPQLVKAGSGRPPSRARAPHEAFTHEAATAKCREKLPVDDLYFRSCVFDLLTTGDVNFTLAAYYALEDVKNLHSNKDKFHIYQRTADPPPGNSAPGQPSLKALAIKHLLLICWLWCYLTHL